MSLPPRSFIEIESVCWLSITDGVWPLRWTPSSARASCRWPSTSLEVASNRFTKFQMTWRFVFNELCIARFFSSGTLCTFASILGLGGASSEQTHKKKYWQSCFNLSLCRQYHHLLLTIPRVLDSTQLNGAAITCS